MFKVASEKRVMKKRASQFNGIFNHFAGWAPKKCWIFLRGSTSKMIEYFSIELSIAGYPEKNRHNTQFELLFAHKDIIMGCVTVGVRVRHQFLSMIIFITDSHFNSNHVCFELKYYLRTSGRPRYIHSCSIARCLSHQLCNRIIIKQ